MTGETRRGEGDTWKLMELRLMRQSDEMKRENMLKETMDRLGVEAK